MNFSIGGREGVQNDQSRCLISWHSWRSFFINKAKKNVFLGGQMKNGKKAFFRKMLEASAKLPTKTSHQYPQFLRKGLFFWKFFHKQRITKLSVLRLSVGTTRQPINGAFNQGAIQQNPTEFFFRNVSDLGLVI